jgi:hypothetical protein
MVTNPELFNKTALYRNGVELDKADLDFGP